MNATKIRVSIVNYSNTLPFKWALKNSALMQKIDLQEDIPSICAQKLKYGQVDLALVPVALLAELDPYLIQSRYCIGAVGKVDSVKLYSKVPVEQIEQISLDYQSKTSNALLRILMQNHWKKTVQYLEALPGFEDNIQGKHAAVVIGDRTFGMNGRYPYEYDLSETWQNYCGLPFVFACWASTKPLDSVFLQEFNDCLSHGIRHIDKAVEEYGKHADADPHYLLDYLTKRIDYVLDEKKQEALSLFLKLIHSM